MFWRQVFERGGVLQPRQNLVEDLLWSRDPLEGLLKGQIVRIVRADIFEPSGPLQYNALQEKARKEQASALQAGIENGRPFTSLSNLQRSTDKSSWEILTRLQVWF